MHGLGGWAGLGLVGSALANVIGQAVGGGAVPRARWSGSAAGCGCRLRPQPAVLRAQLALARDLLARSLAFQACFLSAAAVATRFGAPDRRRAPDRAAAVGFQALVLDAVAIAAQSLVGAALGAPDAAAEARARAVARQVTRYGLVLGSAVRRRCSRRWPGCCRRCSPRTPAVLAVVPIAWWFFVALQPVAGVVFAIDGVLLGAGDAAFLRTSTLLAAVARLPAADLGVARRSAGGWPASGPGWRCSC